MSRSWLESLEPEARERAERLIGRLRELGAPHPESWARRELREGLPQISRLLLLRQLRDETIDTWRESLLWIDNLSEDARREAPGLFGDAARAVSEMLAAGIDRESIGALARFVAYESVFSVIHSVDEEFDTEHEDPLPGWALVELDSLGHLTNRRLNRLHDDLPSVAGISDGPPRQG
jgi:hypothetical protein